MYYKDIPEYYNKTQLNNIFNPLDKTVQDGDILITSDEAYSAFDKSITQSLNDVLPSQNDDYDKTIQEMYNAKELSKQGVKLTYLSNEEKTAKTALSKDMRKTFKLVKARQILADTHTYSTASNIGVELNHKFLASFENNSLSNHVESSDTYRMKESIEFLMGKNKTQAEKTEFLKNHISKISDYKNELLKKGSDKDFATCFDPKYHKASALEGLGSIPDLAQKFNIPLDDATKRKCEYLGKLGKSVKEYMDANAQRISDVAYGTLEEDSAKQFSSAFTAVKDASDEIDPNKNTYYSQALEDCKKANYDLMKAFVKESVAELNVDPESAFIDANGNIAKIDDLDKINPNLDPTVVFDAEGNLKTFVDFDDISGKPTTYEDVKTYDIKDKAKAQEACDNFKSDLQNCKLFQDPQDENLKAIKSNLGLLSDKKNTKVNAEELTQKTVSLCRNYINNVKNNPNASEDERAMALVMGDMYRSMCCSLGKLELERLNEKRKEIKQDEKKVKKEEKEVKNEEKDITEDLSTVKKTKKQRRALERQEKRRQKSEKDYEKFIDKISKLDSMISVENKEGEIVDFEMTEILQDDLARDTRKINGTFTDKKDKNLSLSVEKQREMKLKERESINPENDEGSINRNDSLSK